MGILRAMGIGVVTALLAVATDLVRADTPPKQGASAPVDVGLLEFLGSIDTPVDATQPDDGGWLADLSQINIGKVAKASQAPTQAPAQPKRASRPAGADKPSGPGAGGPSG